MRGWRTLSVVWPGEGWALTDHAQNALHVNEHVSGFKPRSVDGTAQVHSDLTTTPSHGMDGDIVFTWCGI